MLIAEELVLLSLDPDGTPARGLTTATSAIGVTGALVAELVQDGHVTLDGGRVGFTGTVPTDPLLRQTVDGLARLEGKRLRSRLDSIKDAGWPEVVDRMVDAGLLGRRRPSPLQPTRHPPLDPDAHSALLTRIRTAARDDGRIDARDATLLALAGPCQLLEVVAPDRADRQHAKRRIAEAAVQVPTAAAVRYAVDAATATPATGSIGA